MTIFEEMPALSPVQFFNLSWDCPYLKGSLKSASDFKLPSVEDFCAEESFADLYMGWNEEKISLTADVKDRTEEDSIELFFDTRDLKTRSQVSKFCHHFIFTPDAAGGLHGKEVTRFHNDDLHRLCDPEDLKVSVDSSSSAYTLKIEIPSHCLYGYDPAQFSRIGFTYRINRAKAPSQHFAATSEEYAIEQQPSLWATLKLMGKNR